MNDFTKDELNDLLYCINISCKQGVIVPSDKDCYYLYEKLIPMIDNYCEHDSKENIGGFCWKCVKCGMKFGDETQ